MQLRTLTVLVPLLLAGCGSHDIGKDTGNIASDTNTIKVAQAAANEVVRSAGDCEAVKAALPEATRALEDAGRNVRTAAGQQTLEALKIRVKSIADACN